jgi:hypothetical protein
LAIGIVAQLLFYYTLLYAHLLRSSAFSGPYLAADAHRVWLRVGGLRRPRVVVLPWSAVEHVELRDVPKGMFSVRHVCLYAPAQVPEAGADRKIVRDTKAAMKATGTPFCVNIRQVHGTPAALVARLREYAATASLR